MIILSSFHDDLHALEYGKVKSFLNPYSLDYFLSDAEDFDKIEFYSDGILTSLIFSVFFLKKVRRYSFDETSLAPLVYNKIIDNCLDVSFVGGTAGEIEVFSEKITTKYEGLEISYYRDGFFSKKDYPYVASEIICSDAKVCVIGMGTPLQEEFAMYLIDYGYTGAVFTCGGYISQTASSKSSDYYPQIVDDLNLRFLYRFYKEPHTRKRYLYDYPVNIVKFLLLAAMRRVDMRLK